ncbi:MAG: hypothetical protein IPJ41_06755 [Phycisphaerales bacterium]|nr:hypothetical protein [Phycisphaerales bacterium]
MRRPTPTLLAGLWVVALAGCGGTTGPASAPNPAEATASQGNAAAAYRAVADQLGAPLLEALKGDGTDVSALAKHASDLDRLVEATRSPACDFGIDTSAGLGTELPHLPMLRGLARALKADASRLLAAGDADGAARRVAALLRMAAQTSRQGHFTIELLTAASVARLGTDFVNSNPGITHAAWKTDIQNALVEVERGGTLDSWSVLQREAELSSRWIREGSVPDMREQGGHNWPGMSRSEREAAAAQLDSLMRCRVGLGGAGCGGAACCHRLAGGPPAGPGSLSPGRASPNDDRRTQYIAGGREGCPGELGWGRSPRGPSPRKPAGGHDAPSFVTRHPAPAFASPAASRAPTNSLPPDARMGARTTTHDPHRESSFLEGASAGEAAPALKRWRRSSGSTPRSLRRLSPRT